MIYNLGQENSLLNVFISEIRDAEIQKDSMRFRRNLERIGEIFAYEVSKKMEYESREFITSLGTAEVSVLKENPVLATILRAGLPFHQGILNFFDRAQNAFISAYRRHHKSGKFDIQVEYTSSPNIDDKILILSDPMLATGSSMFLAYKHLLENGKPKHTHILAIVASSQGVEYIKKHIPGENFTLWVAAIDDELTAQSYIVPGLGDAGDLAYGSKL
ncbi:MAG TPA: uracil phosphoribosyltransferase [Bacteroidales bacterium]|nr:uracil phosphoribosyltransferase [Bacteroidales bacterium]HPS17978.1 uracil phosphoribosyltransferase [Bacteroidales bacterium]